MLCFCSLKVCVTNANEEQNGAKSVMKYLSSSHLSFFISVPPRDEVPSEPGFVVPASSSILSLLVEAPLPAATCCLPAEAPVQGKRAPGAESQRARRATTCYQEPELSSLENVSA